MKSFEVFLHSRDLHRQRSQVEKSPFSILDADEQHILKLLMFKNIAGSGKTVVHATNCPLLGHRNKPQQCNTLECKKIFASASLRTVIYQMLKSGFEDLGTTGAWNKANGTGNPVESKLVLSYILKVTEEQAKAGSL